MKSLADLCELHDVPRQRAVEAFDSLRRRLRLRGGDATDAFDLLSWARRHLPAHFARPPSSMHCWLADGLTAMRGGRGLKLNCLGPRGHAKSTIGTLAFPLCAALEGWHRYIWIVSDTKHQARGHLENIGAELLENAALRDRYRHALGCGARLRAGRIELADGATIEAYGTGQRIRGRRRRELRPSLIVCDDLQNDGHMRSAAQRQQSLAWFDGTLMKAGTSRTNVVNLATALHHEALAMVLLRRPGWTSRVFRAIEAWPDDMALWQQWETIYADATNPRASQAAREFFEARRGALEAGARLLWPDEEDLYALMCLRAENGRTAFEREKQNSPIDPAACEWPESYFDEPLWFEAWPSATIVRTMALDPSKGADARRGDYSALVLLGVDRQGIVYVEADLARRPTPQMVADGVELFGRFRPDVFGIESNQFQELLAGEFETEFRRQGMLGARPWPIENRTSKLVRIRRLSPYLASRRLRFRQTPGTRLLVEQLKQFPLADHDDGPDALEMALRLAADLLAARRGGEVVGRLGTPMT
jgi:predicted phage terminase large subunit-like protein